jgi:hypothetical protein
VSPRPTVLIPVMRKAIRPRLTTTSSRATTIRPVLGGSIGNNYDRSAGC